MIKCYYSWRFYKGITLVCNILVNKKTNDYEIAQAIFVVFLFCIDFRRNYSANKYEGLPNE